jgi:hypothetical protein
MSEKIVIKQKIVLKKKEENPQPAPVIETQITEKVTLTKPSKSIKKKGLKSHIKKYFCKPLCELIENDGVNDGVLIANPEALRVLEEILNSIVERKKITIVEILESFAFEDVEDEQDEQEEETIEEEQEEENIEEEEVAEESEDEIVSEDSENEDEDDDDEEDEEAVEEEDEYDYEDLQEARECDSYMGYEEDESMDG